MPKGHTSAIDHEKIKEFVALVNNSGLPNFKWASSWVMGAESIDKFDYAEVEFRNHNGAFRNSIYEYKKKPLRFLHFTSVASAIAILRSKTIRMYSLASMADKREMSCFNDLIIENNQWTMQEMKRRIFCLSMCEESLENNRKSLSAWRQYGSGGHGVGLILEFEPTYKNHWLEYNLSPVKYKDSQRKVAQNLFNKYKEFRATRNFNITNFDRLIYSLSAFHKDIEYLDEREVRLLYHTSEFDNNTLTLGKEIIHPDFRPSTGQAEYINLKLENRPHKELAAALPAVVKMVPFISINKILTGPEMSTKQFNEFKETVGHLVKNYEVAPSIDRSILFR